MDGTVEIITIDEMSFGEWVEVEVAVDQTRCLPFMVTRRQWNAIRNDDEQVRKFLYQFGKSMNEKMGTFKNPLPQRQVEEFA